LKRNSVTGPPLFTIGYEGSTIAHVLSALRGANVSLLVDVRAVAASRKPGFSKRQLAASLDEASIGYVHLLGLGTPKAGRQAVRAGRPEVMRAIFVKHMQSDPAQFDLASLLGLASERATCLLCFERDPATCHRSIVAEFIVAQTGQAVEHLTPHTD
jgi:uncharacterized protein (DUF488 family)